MSNDYSLFLNILYDRYYKMEDSITITIFRYTLHKVVWKLKEIVTFLRSYGSDSFRHTEKLGQFLTISLYIGKQEV